MNAVQVVSTMGTTTLEDVAGAARDPSRHMFQLYVIKDRSFTQQLVQARAEIMSRTLISDVPFPKEL